MNKDAVLKYLMRCISDLAYHSRLVSELLSICGSGYEKRFFTLLVARLRQLSVLGVNAIRLEEFENIGQGLYSMHFSEKGFNIRVLYSFLPDGQPVLLLAFYERGGKRKTDYTRYIAPALDRLSEKKEEFCNG